MKLANVIDNHAIHYSGLPNKRAGWNRMCRLENRTKFESFENLELCWVDQTHFQALIRLVMAKISLFHSNESQLKFEYY